MNVLKFGGTSLAGTTRLHAAARIVLAATGRGPVVVVASAMAGVTDTLVAARAAAASARPTWRPLVRELRALHLEAVCVARPEQRDTLAATLAARSDDLARTLAGIEALGECPPASGDRVLACGERLAVPLFVAALRAIGVAAEEVDASELIVTDTRFGEAEPDTAATRRKTRRRLGRLATGAVAVVPGFVAAAADGRTTTLGRGGSDFSAALLGAALDARLVEIWTDVDGVLAAPPAIVPHARPIPALSFAEAEELAFYGARVLHPRTVRPLIEHRIAVRVANSLQPGHPGTLLGASPLSPSGVCAVAGIAAASILTLDPGPGQWGAAAARAVFARLLATPVELLIAGQASAGQRAEVAVRGGDAARAAETLAGCGVAVAREDGLAVVAAVGAQVGEDPGALACVLGTLHRAGITCRMVTISPHAVVAAIPAAAFELAILRLHDHLVARVPAPRPSMKLPRSAATAPWRATIGAAR